MAAPGFTTVNNPNPAEHAEAVSPSDTVNFTKATRGLYVGTGGTLVAVMPDNTAITFVNVQGGSVLPIRCVRVNLTGLGASNIVALF